MTPEVQCACGAWVMACWTVLVTSTGSHAVAGCDPRDIGTANEDAGGPRLSSVPTHP
jgi:hypothetical protein